MGTITLRIDDALHRRLREAAAAQDRSLNAYASLVLGAAIDPDLAGDEAQRVRERLARAGLLATDIGEPRRRPPRSAVARARSAAGSGTPLADLVREGRG